MTKTKVASVSHEALTQAAQWYIQQGQDDYNPQHQHEFQQWLMVEAHQVAWQKISRVTQAFEHYKQQDSHYVIGSTLQNLHQNKQGNSRRTVLRGIAALAVGGLSWRLSPMIKGFGQSQLAQYQTAVGEIKQQQLSDGSMLWLNTNSALDENYQKHQRELILYQGDVYIATASDRRPLFVSATLAGQAITYTALGTEFLIEQRESQGQLTVYSGSVRIDYNQQILTVDAGQQITITNQGFSHVVIASHDRLAWQQKELRVKNITLRDFCQQFERYHHGVITVSEQVADLRVMGIFPIFDKAASLEMLAQSLPITIKHHMPWWISIH